MDIKLEKTKVTSTGETTSEPKVDMNTKTLNNLRDLCTQLNRDRDMDHQQTHGEAESGFWN